MKSISLIILVFLCCSVQCIAQGNTVPRRHPGFSEQIAERKALVRELENYSGIAVIDRKVLDAIGIVPRHLFIPSEFRSYAYENRPLPIGYNQTISQPVIVASMTQLLKVQQGERILEIGTGSGYQAAVLAELECEVYTIEIVPELGKRSQLLLQELGYTNVRVRIGDGYDGWSEYAPYDKIIVTCAPTEVPGKLIEQLSPRGKIVIPIGDADGIQYLVVLRYNSKGKIIRQYQYPVRFVPMTGKAMEDR